MISIASPDDVSALSQLVNSAYRGEAARKGWTHEADLIQGDLRTDQDSLKELIDSPNSVILKYTQDDTITGCVYLEKKNSALYLGMLSVSPAIQARGIGKKLLQAAEDYARKNQCGTIEMTVISVRHELIAWYERNGYHKTSRTEPFHVDEKFGIPRQDIHFIVMEKKLN